MVRSGIPKTRTGIYGLRTPDSNSINVILMNFAKSGLNNMRLEPPHVLMEWDEETFTYLTDQLKCIPETFVRTGGTLFMHPRLYENGMPPLLHSLYTLCSMHSHLTDSDQEILSDAIFHTTSTLLQASSTIHTLPAILEFVQALILLQILTLFTPYPNPTIHSAAEARLPLLSHWAHRLYLSAPSTLPSSLSPRSAWILAESVRRTIPYAQKIQAMYSMLTRGYFRLTLFTEALPVNRVSRFWDQEEGGEASEEAVETQLVSYRELTDGWEMRGLGEVGAFEELLLVACKGMEVKSRPYGI